MPSKTPSTYYAFSEPIGIHLSQASLKDTPGKATLNLRFHRPLTELAKGAKFSVNSIGLGIIEFTVNRPGRTAICKRLPGHDWPVVGEPVYTSVDAICIHHKKKKTEKSATSVVDVINDVAKLVDRISQLPALPVPDHRQLIRAVDRALTKAIRVPIAGI